MPWLASKNQIANRGPTASVELFLALLRNQRLNQIRSLKPRTPPHVLVAISWNLACALKETPPFTDGFDDATHKTSKCELKIGARAPTPDDGGKAAGFILYKFLKMAPP